MRIAIAVLCLTVLSLSVAVSAPVGKAQIRVPSHARALALPDLIVKQVVVSRSSAEFPTYTFRITVANIGTREARPTKTGIVTYALLRTDQPMMAGTLGEVATPTIAPGAETVVTITNAVATSKMYLFVTADFPTKVAQLGAIREKKEGNNVLVVPLNTGASFPRTFR